MPVIETTAGLFDTVRTVASVSHTDCVGAWGRGLRWGHWAGLGRAAHVGGADADIALSHPLAARHHDSSARPPASQVNPGILPESQSKIAHAKELFAQHIDANVIASQLAARWA